MATQAVAQEPVDLPRFGGRSSYLWYTIRRSTSAQAGIVLLTCILLAALAGPALWQIDPAVTDAPPLAPPDLLLPFGSDQFGRDLLSRVLNGIRLDLAIAVFVALLATILGSTIGVLVGYVGGWVDQVLMRVTDVMLAFPGFILALSIAAFLGNDIHNVIIAIAIAYTPVMVRLVRGQALSLRSAQFILASRTIGAPSWWIMLLHMLPNTLSPTPPASPRRNSRPGRSSTRLASALSASASGRRLQSWARLRAKGLHSWCPEPGGSQFCRVS